VAWNLVAAQRDIASRDYVTNTMRTRWWRQLGSCAINHLQAQAQQRRLQALRCAYKETQQVAVQELQLEKAATAAEIESLKVQLEDWHQEQANRAEAQKTQQQSTAQCASEERRLETLEQQFAALQQDNTAAAVHILSARAVELERHCQQWQHKCHGLEQQLIALQQQHAEDVEYTAGLQEDYGKLIEQYDSLSAQHDSGLQQGIEMQERISDLLKELQRLEHKGATVYWWRV